MLTFLAVGTNGASRTILARTGTNGSGLVCALAEIPPGGELAGAAGTGGELWFVIDGSARIELGGAPGPELISDRGMQVPAGTAYTLKCDGAARLRLHMVALPVMRSRPTSREVSRDLQDCPAETTGDRTFRVLFGPGRDCPVATQFVGEIPPGRAPEHSHPYDEVVLVLQGSGVAHVGGTDRALSAGTCLHLPPGLRHCLENTGPDVMRVLGVFHPADSPAAKLQH